LEALTFEDNSIDLHITQDVFEHIFDPEAAFREIARTLRPGGAHIFTVPMFEKEGETVKCAALVNGQIVHFRKPEYHGNPISADGSLVTTRWGYDICNFIARTTGLFTQIVFIDALEHGIRADLNEVLITRKPAEHHTR
jgi:SAM-dependent methyltransferase